MLPAPIDFVVARSILIRMDRNLTIDDLFSCVEDYIMNLVFETPAVPADKEYVQGIFHLEDVNTKFGIYTLTIPA